MNHPSTAAHIECPYDVIVIGGGPSGMMAAGRAAERGARVLLLEKNQNLGKKLLITGGGRCNVTNAEFDTRTLLTHYGGSAKFLFSPFATFDVRATLDFFHNRGMQTKIEAQQRVFPVSDSASSVHQVLSDYLQTGNASVETGAVVEALVVNNQLVTGVQLTNGRTYSAPHYILATGGKSRPETGSTGDGFKWLEALGHTVSEPDPSLVPIALHEPWIRQLAGITLPSIKITAYQSGQKAFSKRGRLLFTHVGISGPTVLNVSKAIGELLEYGSVTLSLDLFPEYDHGSLDQMLITHFSEQSNKLCKNALAAFIPTNLVSIIFSMVAIPTETKCHSLSKESRKTLGRILKDLPMRVQGLLGADKAIVTSGGIALTEVDFRTMQSRLIPNLYITGDLLNIDRPSGGYSLQLCWTTGYVAGSAVPIHHEYKNEVFTEFQ